MAEANQHGPSKRMNGSPARLDHAVINVRYDMDDAVRRFASLGFTLTPRGHHSLGSINHLMVFDGDYLELIGVERGANRIRREVADSPAGLNGLVFRTFDADACHLSLQERGLPAEPPLAFSRPVTLNGAEELAQFRTVRLKPGVLRGGRVYFCEHLTPHLVWRKEWQSHPNGVDRVLEFIIVVQDPGQQAAAYQTMLFAPAQRVCSEEWSVDGGRYTIRLMSAGRFRDRFGPCAPSEEDRADFMGALVLHTASMAKLRHCLAELLDAGEVVDSTWSRSGSSITVPASRTFGAVLEFTA